MGRGMKGGVGKCGGGGVRGNVGKGEGRDMWGIKSVLGPHTSTHFPTSSPLPCPHPFPTRQHTSPLTPYTFPHPPLTSFLTSPHTPTHFPTSPPTSPISLPTAPLTRACNGMEWNGMEDGMEEEFWYGIWKTSGMERNGRF